MKRIIKLVICVLAICASAWSASPADEGRRNLVPDKLGATPNYWCTWAAQCYVHGQGAKELDPKILEGSSGAALGRVNLTEKLVFAEDGWANRFFAKVRGDLYLMFDDGWDVPQDDNPLDGLGAQKAYRAYFGSLEVNEERFPSCKGTPGERLKKLNEMTKAAGWRGAGLWVCAQEAPKDAERKKAFISEDTYEKMYWSERMQWTREAGIEHWKVDWGRKTNSDRFRRMITELARQKVPNLFVLQTRKSLF